MRIVDALIKALEARGFPVSTGEGESAKPLVEVLGQKVGFSLEEQIQQRERQPDPEEPRGRYQSMFDRQSRPGPLPKYDYTPTGRLSVRIFNTLGSGYRQTWSDGQRSLDNMLNSFINGLVTAAQETKSNLFRVSRFKLVLLR
jgi:hypothetical protein